MFKLIRKGKVAFIETLIFYKSLYPLEKASDASLI